MNFLIRVLVLVCLEITFTRLGAQTLVTEQISGANDLLVTGTTSVQKRIDFAIDPNTGKKVFVWQEDVGGTGNKDVYCAVYDINMNLLNQFVVNSVTTGDQAYPSVKINPNDKSFLVSWSSYINNTDVNDANKYDIYAKKIRFDYINTDKLNSDLLINSNYIAGSQIIPVVAFDFVLNEAVIAWIDQNGRDRLPTVVSSDYGSYARRVNYAGATLALISGANDFQINSSAINGHQAIVTIEISPITNELYAVSQQQNFPGGGGSSYDIIFRKFTRGSGNNFTGATEVMVNTMAVNNQQSPFILINSKTGDYIISWQTDYYPGGITGWDSYSKVYDKQGSVLKSDFKVAPFATNNNELGPKSVWDEYTGNVIYFHWYSVGSTTNIRYTVFDNTFTKIQNDVTAISRNLNNSFSIAYKPLYDQTLRKVFLAFDEYNATNSAISNGYYAQMKYAVSATTSTSTQNYVEVQTLYKEVKEEQLLTQLPVGVAEVERHYLDGLGRPIQKVSIQTSPSNKDEVEFVEYDAIGRQVKSFLPYVHSSEDGAYKNDYSTAQANFYNNNSNNNADRIINDQYPYSEVVFESNVPNRTVEQGSPGNSWKLGSGHTRYVVKTINSTSDNVRNWTITANGAFSTAIYSNGSLFKNIETDEMGKNVETFKDKFGNVICIKELAPGCVSATCTQITYKIYDDFGNLKYVISPQAVDELISGGVWNIVYNGTSNIDLMVNGYKYDKRQRLIEKKRPGKAVESIIYNNMNLPVVTQDGNFKNSNKWKFSKYDALGRIIMTGVVNENRSITTILSDINSRPLFETRNPSTSTLYTNNAYPIVTTADILTITYYDDHNYDFDNNPGTSQPYAVAGFSPEPIPGLRNKGRITGTKVKNLNDNNWLISVIHYDKYGRRIQAISNNHKNYSLQSYTTFQYDFAGQLLNKKEIINTTLDVITSIGRFEYDNNSRLKKSFKKINSNTEILLSSISYNEMGQIVEKNLHSENAINFLQSVDYTYNIRGWMTHINNSTLSNSSLNTIPEDNNNDASDLFGMEIVFDKPVIWTSNVPTQYNGNIAAVLWKTNNPNLSMEEKSYVYRYDGFSRLIDAQYGTKQAGVYQFDNKYRESNITYDKNGNIVNLSRWGSSTSSPIDNLQYNYSSTGNQLKKVFDAGNSSGFNDRIDQGIEYTYDLNGNLISDANKGITLITYNHLNLPVRIEFGSSSNNNRIEFDYDATGTMLSKRIIKNASIVFTNDYVKSIYYENNSFQYILTEEGRATRSGSNYNYEYFITDYLGNLRVIFGKNVSTGLAEIVQENNYYALGMVIQPSWTPSIPHNFLYGGKEYQNGIDVTSDLINDYDWDVYHFGARMYDPLVARWLSVDPANQDASPYIYCANNPINYIDPNGMSWLSNVLSSKPFKFIISGAEIVTGTVLMATGAGSVAGAALIVSGISFYAQVADNTINKGMSFGSAVNATGWTIGFAGNLDNGSSSQTPSSNSNNSTSVTTNYEFYDGELALASNNSNYLPLSIFNVNGANGGISPSSFRFSKITSNWRSAGVSNIFLTAQIFPEPRQGVIFQIEVGTPLKTGGISIGYEYAQDKAAAAANYAAEQILRNPEVFYTFGYQATIPKLFAKFMEIQLNVSIPGARVNTPVINRTIPIYPAIYE